MDRKKGTKTTNIAGSDVSREVTKEQNDVETLKVGIKKGDLKTVATLVQKNEKLLEHCYSYNNYPLHLAAESGHFEVVKHLVEKFAGAVIKKNDHKETPIYIAIKKNDLKSVKEMFPYFKRKVIEEGKTELPGKSLVHAVLEHCSDKWEDYFRLLFGDHKELRLEEKDNEKLKQMLRESYEGNASPLSWLIRRPDGDKKDEALAIDVVKKYPELMKVKDKYAHKPLPIHQAIIEGKFDFLKESLKQKKDFYLGTNKYGQNILHLAAMNENYCNEKIFEIFRGLEGIYGLVRQKGGNERTPLELAAWSDGGKKETNDEFLLFSAKLKKPAKQMK